MKYDSIYYVNYAKCNISLNSLNFSFEVYKVYKSNNQLSISNQLAKEFIYQMVIIKVQKLLLF